MELDDAVLNSSKKRKIQPISNTHPMNNGFNNNHATHTDHQDLTRSKNFLFLPSDWHIYHSQGPMRLPYSSNQNSGDSDTLYLPLENNIMINVTKYHEITFEEGNYFLADKNGVYDRTAQGTLLNFLVHCSHERRLYIARSILILDPQIMEELSKQLLDG